MFRFVSPKRSHSRTKFRHPILRNETLPTLRIWMRMWLSVKITRILIPIFTARVFFLLVLLIFLFLFLFVFFVKSFVLKVRVWNRGLLKFLSRNRWLVLIELFNCALIKIYLLILEKLVILRHSRSGIANIRLR